MSEVNILRCNFCEALEVCLPEDARDEELTALYKFKSMHGKYIPVRIAEKFAPQVTYLTWMTLVTVF